MAERFGISAMPHPSISEEGSRVQMEFATNTGQVFVLNISPADLEAWIARAYQLTNYILERNACGADHRVVQAVEVEEVEAMAALGSNKVILGFRGSNGLPQSFALRPPKSAELRQQMQRAEVSARAQTSKARN